MKTCPFAVAGLGRERQDDAVVEFGVAHAPFLAHAYGKLKRLLAAEVGVGHHDNAVGRRVVEGADGLVELRFVLWGEDVGIVVNKRARRALFGQAVQVGLGQQRSWPSVARAEQEGGRRFMIRN